MQAPTQMGMSTAGGGLFAGTTAPFGAGPSVLSAAPMQLPDIHSSSANPWEVYATRPVTINAEEELKKIQAERDNFRRMRQDGSVTITKEHFTPDGDYMRTSFTQPGGFHFGARPPQYDNEIEERERAARKRQLKSGRTYFDAPRTEELLPGSQSAFKRTFSAASGFS
jgi:hypothetical protein